MKKQEAAKNKLILLPRSHRKTTYCTAADALQIALPDDLNLCPYPRNLGPDVRIAIMHETELMASKIMGEIKNWVGNNELLRALFPDILPEHRKRRDNSSEFEFCRKASWKEATFTALGVGTKAQGNHFNRLKLDDIYGVAARESPAVHETTLQWFDELQPFLVTPKTDGMDIVGTRYDHKDVYAHALKKYEDKLPRYIRSVVEFNPETQLYEPIFPAMFTLESLEDLKKNRKVWTANYLNAPDFREDADLKEEWIRTYDWTNKREGTLVGFTGTERIKRHTNQLDKLLFIDPAPDGDCGWILTGCDHVANHPNIFILDAYRGPIRGDIMIDRIFDAVERWGLRAVCIEEVNFSKLYKTFLEAEMRRRRIYFNVIGLKTGGRLKDSRVLALVPYFAAGQIFFHSSQQALFEEYRQFGTGSAYHILDALAYGPEHWRAASDSGAEHRRKEADKRFREARNSLTGYTRTG